MAKQAALRGVAKKIVDSAGEIHRGILRRRKPSIQIPSRSLSNCRYTPKTGYFELKGSKKISGEDCYEIHVVYASENAPEATWYFSKKDFLPRRVECRRAR